MRSLQILFCVFCCVFIRCSALNCRTSGGPSLEELKSIYRTCLKRQDNRSSSGSSEESTINRRTQDNQGSRGGYNNNDDWSSLGDFAGHAGGMGGGDWSDGSRSSYDRSRNNNRGMNTNNDMTTRTSDAMGRNGNNMYRYSDQTHVMNSDHMNRNGYMGDQYGTQDMPRYNYPQAAPPARRYRRDKTSGHRSQYNPNTSWKTSTGRDDNREDQSGSSENSTSKSERKKACALHCFMQEFEMIGDNDMPDKYLVVQGLTKYANNEDLKEFLQDAVEECFQIVQNENKKDKCEFSKNLGLCLSEKGRANCEDWKEELKL